MWHRPVHPQVSGRGTNQGYIQNIGMLPPPLPHPHPQQHPGGPPLAPVQMMAPAMHAMAAGPSQMLVEPSWEDLLDSGMLDQQLNQMAFRPPLPLPPHHHHPAVQHGLPPGPPSQIPPRMAKPSGIPPLMDIPVARPSHLKGGGSRQPPPRFVVDTSVPPPRIQLLQKPQPQHVPVVLLEDTHRTQYRPPDQKVKILRRPASTPSNLSSQGDAQKEDNNISSGSASALNGAASSVNSGTSSSSKKNNQAKSLKQREEEYAQARLRILGSTGNEEEQMQEVNTDAEPSSVQVVNNGSAVSDQKSNSTVRSPRGPDGTGGFQKHQRKA